MRHEDVLTVIGLAEPGQLVQLGRTAGPDGQPVVLTVQQEGASRLRWDAWAGEAGTTWLGPLERQPAPVRDALLLQAQELVARIAGFAASTPTTDRPDTGVAPPRWARIASRILVRDDATTREPWRDRMEARLMERAHQAADVIWNAGAWVGAVLGTGRRAVGAHVAQRSAALDARLGNPVAKAAQEITVAAAHRRGESRDEALRPTRSLERAFQKTAEAELAPQIHHRLSQKEALVLGLDTAAAGLRQDETGQWHLVWVPGVPPAAWSAALTHGGPPVSGGNVQQRPLTHRDLLQLGPNFTRVIGTLAPGSRIPEAPVIALSRVGATTAGRPAALRR